MHGLETKSADMYSKSANPYSIQTGGGLDDIIAAQDSVAFPPSRNDNGQPHVTEADYKQAERKRSTIKKSISNEENFQQFTSHKANHTVVDLQSGQKQRRGHQQQNFGVLECPDVYLRPPSKAYSMAPTQETQPDPGVKIMVVPGTEKGRNPWSPEEDQNIFRLVRLHGVDKGWKFLSESMPGRTAKQCSERWRNHLDPAVKKHVWTEFEDNTLIRTHQSAGPKWSTMAKLLPGRTDHAIKNRWYSTMRRVNRQYKSKKISAKDMKQPLFLYCFNCLRTGSNTQGRSVQPVPKKRRLVAEREQMKQMKLKNETKSQLQSSLSARQNQPLLARVHPNAKMWPATPQFQQAYQGGQYRQGNNFMFLSNMNRPSAQPMVSVSRVNQYVPQTMGIASGINRPTGAMHHAGSYFRQQQPSMSVHRPLMLQQPLVAQTRLGLHVQQPQTSFVYQQNMSRAVATRVPPGISVGMTKGYGGGGMKRARPTSFNAVGGTIPQQALPLFTQSRVAQSRNPVSFSCYSCGGAIEPARIKEMQAELDFFPKPVKMKTDDPMMIDSCSREHSLYPYAIGYEVISPDKENVPRLDKVAELYFNMHLGTIPKNICELAVKGGKYREFDFTEYRTVVLFQNDGNDKKIISAATFHLHTNGGHRCLEMLLFASDPTKHYGYGRLLLAILGEIASTRDIPVILTCASVHTIGHWEQVGFSSQRQHTQYWKAKMQKLTGQSILQQVVKSPEYHHHTIAWIVLGLPASPPLGQVPENAVVMIPDLEMRVKKFRAQMQVGKPFMCAKCTKKQSPALVAQAFGAEDNSAVQKTVLLKPLLKPADSKGTPEIAESTAQESTNVRFDAKPAAELALSQVQVPDPVPSSESADAKLGPSAPQANSIPPAADAKSNSAGIAQQVAAGGAEASTEENIQSANPPIAVRALPLHTNTTSAVKKESILT